jgi:cytochrome c peroxidase
MGVVANAFVEVDAGSDTDVASSVALSSPFMPNGVHLRQVTPRNSTSVLKAVYNVRNFWDGRANNVFTGATPFGDSDTGLHAVVYRNATLTREAVRIENASLASQAVGPVLSSVEMSWAGRSWPELGRKLLNAGAARQTKRFTNRQRDRSDGKCQWQGLEA